MSTLPSETAETAELAALRQELQQGELKTARIERIHRQLARFDHLADLKVAWLGNHTLEPAVRHATVAAFRRGVLLANHLGAFNQHFQALLDADSAVARYAPDAIVLSLSLQGLAPGLGSGSAGLSGQERRAEARRALDHLQQWVDTARSRTDASLLICNFQRPRRPGLGLADLRNPDGDVALCNWLNESIVSLYHDDPRVQIVDIDQAIANAGRDSSWNPRMYHLARIEWDGPGLAAAGNLVARSLRALVCPARKCLVLDLDNTLWGGIVGEDGASGLQIEDGDPAGEAFRAFQRVILDIKARGILLAIASKNNEADAEEVFAQHDMPLKLEHFAARRINWQHKHLSIQSIARELNIGLDSLVFVDDSAVECELIRQMLPEVEVIQLPADPAEYADVLGDCWYFDKLELTEEDTRKTEQYRDHAARTESRRQATDLASYLESLGTTVEIGTAGDGQLPRLHQLFSKTNQFNVTTKRYTLGELKQFIESDDWLFEWLRVRDNFGDLGLVGTYLVRLSGDEPEIDSVVLSCRALGREVETAACNRIKEMALASGARSIAARFAPTPKNKPAADYFERQGFSVVQTGAAEEKLYRVTAADAKPIPCPMLDVTIVEE